MEVDELEYKSLRWLLKVAKMEVDELVRRSFDPQLGVPNFGEEDMTDSTLTSHCLLLC